MNGPQITDPRWPPGTLMSRLDACTAEDLLNLAAGRQHAPGTVLIRAGAPGAHVYLLEPMRRTQSACVKVTAAAESGIETMLGIRAAGDIVGEMAVLGMTKRSATVTVCSPLIAHAIPADTFMAFLSRRPRAWSAITLMISQRLEWSNRRRVDYAGHDSAVQFARVIADIVELYKRPGTPDGRAELGVSLTQPELASLIGASKESAAKAIRKLREGGLISTQYRRIVVLDLAGLRSFAGLTPL